MINLDKILQRCNEINSTLLYFTDKDGKQTLNHTSKEYVWLKCNICGNIYKKSLHHFFERYGCKKCSQTSQKLPMSEIFRHIREKCQNKQISFISFVDGDNNNCEWVNSYQTKLKIQCNKCGYIWFITYHNFISKNDYGCPKCAHNKKLEADEYLNAINSRCTELGDTFNYLCNKNGEITDYKNNTVYLNIQCNKCKNNYIIRYKNFINLKQSCTCDLQSNAEKEIALLLEQNGIDYNFKDKKILNYKRYELDFFLPQYNIGIEIQGRQHFCGIEQWGGKSAFSKQQERDNIKLNICQEKGIKLLYYSDINIKFPYKVYTNKNNLLEEILKSENSSS